MEYWSTGVLEKTAFNNIQSEMIDKQYLDHVPSVGKKFACWSLFHHSITPACLAGALAKADTPTLQSESYHRQSPSRG
jgi:hypothetical protein